MEQNAELRIERVIAAPRELVFRLWSKPEYLVRWFAPRRCTLEVHAFEFRAGGEFKSTIRAPDGSACHALTTFQEIVPAEKLVYTISAQGHEGWPELSTVTVTFADRRNDTLLTLHQTVPEALAKRTGAYPSWLEMLDRLGEELARRQVAAAHPEPR